MRKRGETHGNLGPEQVVVRPAHAADLPWLYEICRATVDMSEFPGSSWRDLEPYLVGQIYMAPYFAFEPSCCFVASAEGRVCGYVVGTVDSARFERFLVNDWLPRVREQFPCDAPPHQGDAPRPDVTQHSGAALQLRDAGFLGLLHAARSRLPSWLDRFPAHLHVDLLPSYQGIGIGRLLLETFFSRAMETNCSGIHVDVARRNQRALEFYRALGFQEALLETQWGITLGRPLSRAASPPSSDEPA